MKLRPADRIWLLVYVLAMVAVAVGIFSLRERAIRALDNPQASGQWQAWKQEVQQRQAEDDAPVKRKVPKSDEPPALVMLRDHFPAVAVGLLVTIGFFLAFLLFVLRGVFGQSRGEVEPAVYNGDSI